MSAYLLDFLMALILPYKDTFPEISDKAFIAATATVIGDVQIGAETGIWYGCTVRGDVHEIRIGKRTNIQDGSVIHVTEGGHGTYIGDEVTVGHMALLHACTIEDRAFIGMGSMVMDGAVVETNGMLAAGAMLTNNKRIKAGELWAGRPAKFWRLMTQEEIDWIPKSADKYAKLAGRYLEVEGA